MLIRRATPSDSSAIAYVFQRAFRPFEHLYTPDSFASTAVGEEVILQRMEAGFSWIALEGTEALGTVSATPTWDGFSVTGMAVLPEAQGKKIAYQLMKTLEDCGREEGYKRIYLYTTTFLDNAIRLYEKFGFTRYGNPADHWMGTTVIQFEKYL